MLSPRESTYKPGELLDIIVREYQLSTSGPKIFVFNGHGMVYNLISTELLLRQVQGEEINIYFNETCIFKGLYQSDGAEAKELCVEGFNTSVFAVIEPLNHAWLVEDDARKYSEFFIPFMLYVQEHLSDYTVLSNTPLIWEGSETQPKYHPCFDWLNSSALVLRNDKLYSPKEK
jgi:hypothetical protein